ncbi:MAG: phosphoenolpyruvate--protein phosphotransferase [Lachnospiraceae bacterium]
MLKGKGISGSIAAGSAMLIGDNKLSDYDEVLKRLDRPTLLVASALTISDAPYLENKHIIGFVLETGGFNTHLEILAKKIGLTSVIDVPGCLDFIADGDQILIDGIEGSVLVNPAEKTLADYKKLKKKRDAEQKQMRSFARRATVTKDGTHISLMGNIDGIQDVDNVLKAGGDGIGLFRTENIYCNSSYLPTEEEQFEIYKAVVLKMAGKVVVIRTLDAGGDHKLPYLQTNPEDKPLFGMRGIRFSLKRPDIFKSQVRAILRASAFGPVRIMLPMVTSVSELVRAKVAINSIKEELDKADIPYDKNTRIGVMIETPAAAYLADLFAKEADFISIGTNDLSQYILAADRDDYQVAYLYSNYHPALLRSIHQIISACRERGTIISICGEAAADTKLLPLLMIYGVEELSVNPLKILPIRQAVTGLDLAKFERLPDVIETASIG